MREIAEFGQLQIYQTILLILILCRGPDFEGTGAGVVKLYFISGCLTVQGITIGMNINDIPDYTDASNAVIITKRTDCICVQIQETKTCSKDKVLMCVNKVSTCVDRKIRKSISTARCNARGMFQVPGITHSNGIYSRN